MIHCSIEPNKNFNFSFSYYKDTGLEMRIFVNPTGFISDVVAADMKLEHDDILRLRDFIDAYLLETKL